MAAEPTETVHDGEDDFDLSAGFRPHGSVHPSGEVTAFDEATGLPIVRRAAASSGGLDVENARPIVQASDDPKELHASASEQKPVIAKMAEAAVSGVPGAKIEGMRVKEAEAVQNKNDRGKPPETIDDHLGARVSAKTPDAVEAIKENIEAKLPVRTSDKIDSNGLNADKYGVQTGKPGDANQQSELQVVTRDQAKAMKATDDLYDRQKKAAAVGDQQEASRLGEQIKTKFDDAKEAAGFSKGDRVKLPDGRIGTIQFYDSKITKNARVLTDDGKMVASVKGKNLERVAPTDQRERDPHKPPEGATHIAPGSDGKMHYTDLKRDLGVVGE
jgi:hypothetical protein